MSIFIVDVEADGPAPGLFSMVSFGAVRVDETLGCTFYGKVAPISDKWVDKQLAVSDTTREQHLKYPHPSLVMPKFVKWVQDNSKGSRMIFMSDNLAFDWQYINYYCHAYVGMNPFGYSGRRIGDLYSGLTRNLYAATKWKKLRQTPHTHNPVDDARGNAEALLTMVKEFGLSLD